MKTKHEKVTDEKLTLLEEETRQRLESLGITGESLDIANQTELEKAQEKYQALLDMKDEYNDEINEKELNKLEYYQEVLNEENNSEINRALEQKSLDLQKAQDEKKVENLKNIELAKAEVEKQRILEASEKKGKELDAKMKKEKGQAEADYLMKKYEMEKQAFNTKKAMDIAQVWITTSAGIAQAWAQAISVPPFMLPATLTMAGINTGMALTVAGVQTGLIAAQPEPPPPVIPAFATGVTNFTGGLALVGEEGPELVNLSPGSNVITNPNTMALMSLMESLKVADSSAGDGTINITLQPVLRASFSGNEFDLPIEQTLIRLQKKDIWRA